jgi:hypothetical protein
VTLSIVLSIIEKFQAAGGSAISNNNSSSNDNANAKGEGTVRPVKMDVERRTLLAQLFGLYVSAQASGQDSALVLQFFYYYSSYNQHPWIPATSNASAKSAKQGKGKQQQEASIPTETKFYVCLDVLLFVSLLVS